MTSYNEVRHTLADAIREAFQKDLNVTEYWPAGMVPPHAAITQQTPAEAFDMSFNGGLTDYKMMVKLAVGKVLDKAAEDRVGELISSRGALITALNDTEIGTGFVHVTQAVREEVNSGIGLLCGARLLVRVVA